MVCYFISYSVVLLPAVEICSIFPLISANLCDNIISYSFQNDDLYKKNYVIFIQKLFVVYRFFFVIVPILISFLLYDLSYLLEIAGTLHIIVSVIFTPLFSISANKIIPKSNRYDFKYNFLVSVIVLIIGVVFFTLSFVFSIIHIITA